MRASACVASILARLRTMPGSAISASPSSRRPSARSFPARSRRTRSKRRALAQDGDPRQARLKAVEHQLLEQRAVVLFGHAPFLVVIGDIERVHARPGAAAEPVGVDERPRRARRLFSLGHGPRARHGLLLPPRLPASSSKRLACAGADRLADRRLQARVVVGDPVDAGSDLDQFERGLRRRLAAARVAVAARPRRRRARRRSLARRGSPACGRARSPSARWPRW